MVLAAAWGWDGSVGGWGGAEVCCPLSGLKIIDKGLPRWTNLSSVNWAREKELMTYDCVTRSRQVLVALDIIYYEVL